MSVPPEMMEMGLGMPSQDPMPMGQVLPMVPRGNQGDGFQQALKAEAKRPSAQAEVVNLALYMTEQELKDIAEEDIEEYEQDEESRAEWLDIHGEWVRLYFLKDKPKNPPWSGSSEESMPILVEGCNQFHARAYKSFFGTEKFVTATPIGKASVQDHDRAERVGGYMSWQLSVKDITYKRNKDRLLRQLPLHGSVFTKTYRDPLKKRNVVENVRALDMVVPYGSAGMDVEELERKTQIITLPIRKGKHLFKNKFFIAEPQPYMMVETNPVQEAVDRATGITMPVMGSDKNHARILEQHRYIDLDNDGIAEPYIVWIDYESKKVLRVAVRYDIGELGQPLSNKDPVEYFTHYVYLENPDGVLGLGLGHMTGSMNSAINKLLRQAIDAGTLANNRTGITSQSSGIPKGNLELVMGKINVIPGMMEDIRKMVQFLDYPGADRGNMEMMMMLIQRADRLNMVTEALTGTQDKVVQPTTTLALIEQALTTFSAVETRVYASLQSELMKLYRLNGMYIGEQEYFLINDVMGPQDGIVGKEDFLSDLQVKPVFNLKDATESARMIRAERSMQFSMSSPLIQSSPEHQYEFAKRYLEANGEAGIDKLLPDPQALAEKEQQMMAADQEANRVQEETAKMQAAEKSKADQIAAELKAEELGVRIEEVELKRMLAQADIAHKEAALEIKAEQAEAKIHIDKIIAAAQIDQADELNEIQKIKNAGEYEAKMRALKTKTEGKKK